MNKTSLIQPLDCNQQLDNTSLSSHYQSHGIVYLKNFINTQTLSVLLNEFDLAEKRAEIDIIKNWNNERIFFYSKNAATSQAATKDYAASQYFKKSHDKCHVFYEQIDDSTAVNRIGHGMHLEKQFKTLQQLVYHNPTLNQVLKMSGLIAPICQLSVYIPKYANGIGSDVRPHQESTFAYTEPRSVVVLWLALEDAVIENACMWGILGSHTWPLQFVSRVDHVTNTRHFEKLDHDMVMPDFEKNRARFTPLEVKKGDALFFHGNFVHCSPVNQSQQSRKALSL